MELFLQLNPLPMMKPPPVEMMFMRYLLLPVLAIIMVFIYGFLRKKNALIENKKVIIFALVSALVIGVPGLAGMAGMHFSAGVFFSFQLVYAALGMLYTRMLIRHISSRSTKYRMGLEIVISLAILLLGMYVFSLIFNRFSPIKNGLFVATCAFPVLIPLIFHWSYQAFLDIPPEIYKVWNYISGKTELDLEGLDFNRMMVLEVEFSRQAADEDLLKVKAKAPANVIYGEWFQKFINDYNNKFSGNPIAYADEDDQTYGWIFYVKPTFFRRRRYVDPDLTITENKIGEEKTIVCKRVINQ